MPCVVCHLRYSFSALREALKRSVWTRRQHAIPRDVEALIVNHADGETIEDVADMFKCPIEIVEATSTTRRRGAGK